MLDPVKDALSKKMKDEEEEDKKISGGGGGDTYNITGDYVGGDKNISGGGDGTTTEGDDPSKTDPDDPSKTNKKDDDGSVDETKEGSPCDCEPLDCTGDGASYDIDMLSGKGAGVIDANGNCTNCPTCDDARIKDDDDDGVVDQYCECEGPKKGQQIPEGQDSASFCECEEKPPVEPGGDDDDGEDCPPCEDGTVPKKVNGECDCPGETEKPEDKDKKEEDKKQEEKKEEDQEDDFVLGPGFTGFVDSSGKPLNNKKIKKIMTPSVGTETAIKNADGYDINLPSDADNIQKTRFGLGDISDTDFIYDKKGGKINTMVSTGKINGKEYSAGINSITYGQDGQISGLQLSITLPSLNSEHKKHPLNNDQPLSLNQYRSLVREQYQTYQKTVSKLDKITKGNIPLWCYTRDSKRKPHNACEGMDESLRFTKKDYQAMQLERAQFFKQAKMLGVELSPLSYRSPLNQKEKQPITQEDKLIIGPPYSDEYLISRGVDPKVYRQLVAEQKKEKPVSPRKKKKSPFERRDRSYLNVRKKWMPTSSPMMQMEQPNMEQPNMEQPGMEQPQQNQETIFDKMQMYGDNVREKVDKFVSNARYDSQLDKPIKAINNQEWVGKITEFLKQKKNELIEAKKNKDKQQEQKIFEHVNTLVNDVTTYASKFESWRDRNGGDTTPGNMGGNMTSDGSMKDKRFEADLAFIGDTNTDLGITEEGKIGIKSYGLDDLKYVEDLDQGVFMKDFAGYKNFLEMSKTIQEDAESGRPKNQNIINGQADLLLKNRDSLLSWAHDPLYGQAWIQDYAQGNPDEDLSWAMPESDQFDKDRLEDEVHGWLTDKLSQAYDKYAPKKDLEDVDKIQQETMSSIGDENYSKQTPMQYKTKAQQLIEKYS
jgi:hypothetical protein